MTHPPNQKTLRKAGNITDNYTGTMDISRDGSWANQGACHPVKDKSGDTISRSGGWGDLIIERCKHQHGKTHREKHPSSIRMKKCH